jgi:hypothetical protein
MGKIPNAGVWFILILTLSQKEFMKQLYLLALGTFMILTLHAQTPQAHFTFTGNALDISGNAHHGTVYGATLTYDRFGNANSAYFFDGINDYIDLANAVGLQSNNYTFSVWLKPVSNPASGTAQYAVSIGGNSGDQFITNINASGDIGWNMSGYQLPTGTYDLVSGVMPSPQSWYHVVGIRSDSFSLLYVNGMLADSVAFTPGTLPKYGQNFANIGRRTFNQFQYFHGVNDDLQIFTSASWPSTNNSSPYPSCWEILSANPGIPDGNYLIDPDGPGGVNAFNCSCDMTTDGGGWTLVSNYNHLAGTNPPLQYRSSDLPLLGSLSMGVDESGTGYWGNASNALMNQIPFDTLRWYGTSSQAGKVTHFKSGFPGAWTMAKTGIGDYSGMNSSKTVYPDNTSVNINCIATSGNYGNNWANLMQCFGIDIWSVGIQSSGACTPYPGWPNIWQWSIDASYCDNNHPNSLHRIWVKGPNPCNLYNSASNSTVLNSSSICEDGNWKHIANPGNAQEIITSVDDNQLNLGAITASVYLEPGATGLYNGQYFLKRHYVITTQNNPVGIKRVRLYFTNIEFNDLKNVDPTIQSIADLKVTKYSGPTADGVYDPSDANTIVLIPNNMITVGSVYGLHFLEFDVDGFSEFWINGGFNAPLPVQLKSFDAQICKEQSCLYWSSTSEQGLSQYEIERSSNAYQFESIAQQIALQQSNVVQYYEYQDPQPFQGNNYYRLKCVDENGQFGYSSTIRVNHTTSAEVFVVPAAGQNAQFQILTKADIESCEIFSADGKLLFVVKNNHTISLEPYPQGIYFLRIQVGDQKVIRRVMRN